MSEVDSGREFAQEIVGRLQEAGFQALWAGGCVRDLILGQKPADYDVATSATPEEVMATLPYRAITVGISFGVVRVRQPRRPAAEVEVATFRSDGAYLDGRRPETVVFSSPELDYVGGHDDLKKRLLRAIGDPQARLREDKLRVLRAIRLSARFHFEIEPATLNAVKDMAHQVVTVSRERIAQELVKMLMHPSRARAMELVLETGVAAAILPDLLPMRGIFQGKPIEPEGDLWDHTMLVLELLPADCSFTLAMGALLHDIGKPRCRAFSQGRYRFDNHEQVGARIAESLCRDLKLSNAERERIVWLVEYHQYLGEAKKLRESKLKRILAMPGIDELLALHRADALASTGNTEHVDYCEYYRKAEPAGPINPRPLLTGHDLVRLGLEPGAHFATILDEVREAQLEGQIKNKQAAIEWVERRL
jgi:poly(A) polymerase